MQKGKQKPKIRLGELSQHCYALYPPRHQLAWWPEADWQREQATGALMDSRRDWAKETALWIPDTQN